MITATDTAIATGERPVTPFDKHPDYQNLDDVDLVRLCQRKDARAFNYLCKRHHGLITAMMFHLVPDFTDQSDVRQNVLIHVWNSIERLRNPHAFKSWLNQIVKNVIYDDLRKRKNASYSISLDDPIFDNNGSQSRPRDIADKRPQPVDQVLMSELSDVIAKAMKTMPEPYGTAVRLRDVEEESYAHIAQIMHIQLGTAKSRICRGRMKLQRLLAPYVA